MFDAELIEKTLLGLAALSASAWQTVEIFQPLFAKVIDDNIRAMLKKLSAGVVAWAASWAFGIHALNAFGFGLHPALDAIVAGLLATGGAAVFNVLFDLLGIWKASAEERVRMYRANTNAIDANTTALNANTTITVDREEESKNI